jgi:membrane protease YdiL (CAAX protease family)
LEKIVTAAAAGTASTTGSTRLSGHVSRMTSEHPVAVVATLLIGLTWTTHFAVLLLGWPPEVALMIEVVLFVTVPLTVARTIGGPSEVKRLLSALARWRIGFGRWLLVLLALPLLTVGVAVITGTYQAPAQGWMPELAVYFLQGLLILGVIGNFPEEMAWGGFVQKRLMDRHGFVVGSLLTAIPFALIHLPLAFDAAGLAGTRWSDVAVTWAVLIGVAPVMRLLMGSVLLGTGGSVLAIGLLHASFNAAGNVSAIGGGWWQNVVALVVLAAVLVGTRLLRKPAAIRAGQK